MTVLSSCRREELCLVIASLKAKVMTFWPCRLVRYCVPHGASCREQESECISYSVKSC